MRLILTLCVVLVVTASTYAQEGVHGWKKFTSKNPSIAHVLERKSVGGVYICQITVHTNGAVIHALVARAHDLSDVPLKYICNYDGRCFKRLCANQEHAKKE